MYYYFKPFEIWQKSLEVKIQQCFSCFDVPCFAVFPTFSKPGDCTLYILVHLNNFLYYVYYNVIFLLIFGLSDILDYPIPSHQMFVFLSRCLSLTLSVSFSLFLFLCLSPSDVVHNSRSKNEMIYSMRCPSVGFR